jgi:hypothetical protein
MYRSDLVHIEICVGDFQDLLWGQLYVWGVPEFFYSRTLYFILLCVHVGDIQYPT